MIGTAIEWASDTVNFWWGCSKVSPACEHCYAEALDHRFAGRVKGPYHWGKDASRKLQTTSALRDLKKIRRRAIKTGERPRVFINSMSDFFEDRRDLDEARLRALDAMRLAPEVDFLLLTKRPEMIVHLLYWAAASNPNGTVALDVGPPELCDWFRLWLNQNTPPSNIWLGTTVENQEWADKRIPELLKVPATVRFLSVEPMLGPVDLTAIKQTVSPGYFGDCLQWYHRPKGAGSWAGISWVICGGESGPGARPMHPNWARSLRDQCSEAGVPYFFKQWGSWGPVRTIGDDPHPSGRGRFALPNGMVTDCNWNGGSGRHLDGALPMLRKREHGRLLDGVEHNATPEVRP